MVFNAAFNNVSIKSLPSVLLIDETGLPGEHHRPVAGHWLTLSHDIASSTTNLLYNSRN
jgi:hypothetical protein